MIKLGLCCRSATFVAVLAGAAPICDPPVAPFLPESDATFKEYADLINQDFERYFTEVSRYSACLNNAHAELMAEAEAVSQLHRQFLERAEALGVTRKAATPAE